MTDQNNDKVFQTPDLVIEETGQYVPAQHAYLNLIRTAQVMGQHVSDLLAEFGLSGKQYNVLRSIRRGGSEGLRVSQISEQMTDPRADVTRLMDRLVRDGLVDRKPDVADRRVVRSVLTDEGAKILQSIDEPLLKIHRSQFELLSESELKQLDFLLQKARGEIVG
ncbi:MarR family winged helix-turn-helix transcriptional regulator [Aliamphritea spongicola]|uniref:MarR family winged helix-turn-helix transcriptional regulator n=1 Tax=Aliamphritea spongicola TaxID=707589 RepID=UPI00196A4F4B|nr:MarR family transcriptional regulator [Aliamphritea spongicola]MBN3562838.1 MarR family transcriptional regulator [Aliamphritea spongicola]